LGGFHKAFTELIPAAAEIFAQVGNINGLSAILGRRDRRNDLGHDRAGNLEALWAFNEFAMHDRSIIQHIPNIDKAAIEHGLDKIVRIMKVKDTFIMSTGNLFRQHNPARQITGYFSGNKVTLGGNHNGVLVGIFFHDILVLVADQRQDGFIRRIGFTDKGPVVAINNVGFGQFVTAAVHDLLFDHILDIFHKEAFPFLSFYEGGDGINIRFRKSFSLLHCFIGLLNGNHDLMPIKGYS